MNLPRKIQMLKRIDTLVQRKATGSPAELASRLGVSRATTFRYIDNLKMLGADIRYCKTRKTYIYNEDFKMIF